MTDLAALPKIDLHCHLDGSLSLEFMNSILRYADHNELRRYVQVDGMTCTSLAGYLEKFQAPLQCLQTAEHIRRAARSFMVSLVPDHVIYVEVRFAPVLLAGPLLSVKDVLELVLAGLKDGQQETGIPFGVILCAMRGHSPERNREVLSLAGDYLGRSVCAMDLAGNEAKYPVSEYRTLFDDASDRGIPFTIHAGECGSAQNIRDAVQLGARRIGHGLAMAGDASLQRLCAERGVGIEMCPTSNFQTKAVSSSEVYPIWEFMDRGLAVTVNTDNRTVSDTTITQEFALLRDRYGFSERDFRQLTQNAIDQCFADDETKQVLTAQALAGYQDRL